MLALLVGTMVLLSFLQVGLRVLWGGGILWADTFLRHLVLWVGFLGAGLAASSDRQFAMDLAARFLAGRSRRAVRFICHLFALAASAALAHASWLFFRQEYDLGQTLFIAFSRAVPAWPFELILPGGFGLLALHYGLRCAATLWAERPDADSR